MGKGACCHAWLSVFNPWNLHDGRRELTCMSYLLSPHVELACMHEPKHVQIYTYHTQHTGTPETKLTFVLANGKTKRPTPNVLSWRPSSRCGPSPSTSGLTFASLPSFLPRYSPFTGAPSRTSLLLGLSLGLQL